MLLLIPLSASQGTAQVVRQLVNSYAGAIWERAALDDAGNTVFAVAQSDQLGGNPSHAYQTFRFDAATGAGTLLTQYRGGTEGVSVSDDGQWLAFSSTGDLIHTRNADRSHEIFVVRSDGSGIKQITSDSTPNGGSSTLPMISGDGNWIVFVSTSDFGSNPGHLAQVMIVNRDGAGLTQLTPTSGVGSFVTPPSISDDGTKVTFTANGNLTGSNADLSLEAFAVLSNGTGLRQLTNNTSPVLLGIPGGAVVSGDGSTIAFDTDQDMLPPSNADRSSEVFVMNWDGTGLRQLSFTLPGPGSLHPAISDTGGAIFFLSHRNNVPGNTDGNAEVFKINKNGTGLTQLTFTTGGFKLYPNVSGSGTRVTFLAYGAPLPWGSNSDLGKEIHVISSTGTSPHQLTDTVTAEAIGPDITSDGNRTFFVSNENFGGLNPGRGFQVWRINSDKTGLQKLTNFDPAKQVQPCSLSVSGDGSKVTFAAQPNPKGVGAPDIYYQVWSMNGDGTALTMLTNGVGDTESVAIARNGSLIAFDTVQNVDGTESPTANSDDVFVIKPDGTGLRRLTTSPAPPFGSFRASHSPRIDGTGTYVTFYSAVNLTGSNADGSYEIFRIKSDGTNLQQLTSGPAGSESGLPDISDDGRWVAFESNGDLAGSNADHNLEIFVYDNHTSVTRQVTNTMSGGNSTARFSDDGQFMVFLSTAPLVEASGVTTADLYRAPLDTLQISRISGVRLSNASAAPHFGVSYSGEHIAFEAIGDPSGTNSDLGADIFLIDRPVEPSVIVNPNSGTIVTWSAESGPLRYDLIRGDLTKLVRNPDGTSNLGFVDCLENNSIDVLSQRVTEQEDPDPFPGKGFFYLLRSSLGLNFGPGSYGLNSEGQERVAASGDCAP
jgi:Tol biopolymer transport system component